MQIKNRYIIGIDLGTTNSAISYVDLSDTKFTIKIFRIPQFSALGELSRLNVLPSFLYIPGQYDIDQDALQLPWQSDTTRFSGAFARDHGAKVPGRLVASAKSWLCHSRVDRHAKILPWGADDSIPKVSPVEATAAYLKHIRLSWNYRMEDDEEAYLENQQIIITVPASFDEIARDLTIEAAKLAGLYDIILLEEPLSAFYSWLYRHEKEWQRYVQNDNLILVCDVGGGTTDFTLITLMEKDGHSMFERIAVGDHLILGGDNIDLTLARQIEMRLKNNQSKSLTADRWQALCFQCREAKEEILSGQTETKQITLVGEGSQLIAGTLKAVLQKEEIEQIVLDGFFPMIDQALMASQTKQPKRKGGITEFGLPYEQEPAITNHLISFLNQHQADVKQMIHRSMPRPDLILFNGGSLKPTIIQNRIQQVIATCFPVENANVPDILENPDPFLAVAVGASYYGLVKMGYGVRVGSGSPRSYYLGIGTDKGQDALCLIERGVEEGSHIKLDQNQFDVQANQPVTFDLLSSSFRSGDKSGELYPIDDSFSSLPPLTTIIQFGKKAGQQKLPVHIEAHYTEMGSLALWCQSAVSPHRWQLCFELRDRNHIIPVSNDEVLEESIIDTVRHSIRTAFYSESEQELNDLSKVISSLVDRPKDKWPLGCLRSMADELIECMSQRKTNSFYESRWLNLIGFSMRPGFGEAMDDHRMNKLWKIYKSGPIAAKQPQVMNEWWIFWRRVAGGLSSGQQRQMSQDLSFMTKQKKGGHARRIPPQERIEMWMAIANMERLNVQDKIDWGRHLLNELTPKKSKPQHFWAMSRIGARELFYGPIDRVISANVVSEWIMTILRQSWRNPKPVALSLYQMARLTGDRKRDIDQKIRDQIADWLKQNGLFTNESKCLYKVIPLTAKEENSVFGESLPPGIMLRLL